MKLTALKASFCRTYVGKATKDHGQRQPDGTIRWGGFKTDYIAKVDTLAEAQGVQFLCPKCYKENGGSIGTHSVIIWFTGRGVPERMCQNSKKEAVTWDIQDSSTSLEDLTLKPSIQLLGGCAWHGFITKGDVHE